MASIGVPITQRQDTCRPRGEPGTMVAPVLLLLRSLLEQLVDPRLTAILIEGVARIAVSTGRACALPVGIRGCSWY
jgi:hypothetical protein